MTQSGYLLSTSAQFPFNQDTERAFEELQVKQEQFYIAPAPPMNIYGFTEPSISYYEEGVPATFTIKRERDPSSKKRRSSKKLKTRSTSLTQTAPVEKPAQAQNQRTLYQAFKEQIKAAGWKEEKKEKMNRAKTQTKGFRTVFIDPTGSRIFRSMPEVKKFLSTLVSLSSPQALSR